jgi:hypothetical protein
MANHFFVPGTIGTGAADRVSFGFEPPWSPLRILNGARVLRWGVTARYVAECDSPIQFGAETRETVDSVDDGPLGYLRLQTQIPSKGGGTTVVEIRLGTQTFPALLQAMMAANRQDAMEAMAAELLEQLKAVRTSDNSPPTGQ